MSYQLSKHPYPTRYDLEYWLDLDTSLGFEGHMQCHLQFDNTSFTKIRMHSMNLTLTKAQLHVHDKIHPVSSWTHAGQELELHFSQGISCENGILEMDFHSRLNTQLAGFYKCTLTDGSIMAMTQFEATDARRAFPCFDEPCKKAVFHLKMNTPKEYMVLSNTGIKKKSHEGLPLRGPFTKVKTGIVSWDFYDTPKMSSYLLAWVVAPIDAFDSLSTVSKESGVETIVYVPRGKLAQAEFASNVGVRALDFFAKVFNMPYPLRLMQHIAVPDFAAGAMENWGLITYREARLTVDAEKTTFAAKRDVARVVAHEISHQWFGNKTTMSTWTDLWLNEGFARYCEFLALCEITEEFKDAWTTFDLDVVGTALRLDSLKSSHAIRVVVMNNPDEINEIFDAVSYAKGATVLRMLSKFLGGQDVFLKGVAAYLKKFEGSNAESDDLWEVLETESGKPKGSIVEIMRAWTTQVGYPLIRVNRVSAGLVKLSQTRYLAMGDDSAEDMANDEVLWTIPASVLSGNERDEAGKFAKESFFTVTPNAPTDELMRLEEQLSKLDAESSWFVINGGNDLYRVAYTDAMWRVLGNEAIAKALVPPRTRLGLVRDVFDLSESGHMNVNVALELALTTLQQTSMERDPTVLLLLLSKLNTLTSLFSESSFAPALNALVLDKITRLLTVLGPWPDSTTMQLSFFGPESAKDQAKMNELRIVVMRLFSECCKSKSDDVVGARAFEYLKDHCLGAQACPTDLRPLIFRLACAYAGKDAFALLLKRFDVAESQETREILSAFSGLQTEADLKAAMDFCRSSKVRSQDVPLCVAALSANKVGARLFWKQFSEDFDWWFKRFSDGNFLWSGIVSSAVSGLTTEAEANQAVDFFVAHPGKLGSAKRALDQSVERVRSKAKQLARDEAKLKTFVENWEKS